MKKIGIILTSVLTTAAVIALTNHFVQTMYGGWYNYLKTLLLQTVVGLAIILLVFLAGFIITILMRK